MKRNKITVKTIVENIDTKEKTESVRQHIETIKSWQELTREEKEKEIENNNEAIYNNYQEELYCIYQDELEDIKNRYKNINFDNIYIDSNSQGGWIDSIKNFKYVGESIEIYGETIDIYDIDIKIHKYIEDITENDVYIYDCYINKYMMDKIVNTKKYKNYINKIVNEVNNWIKEVNDAAREIIKNEYSYPYNLDNEEDRDWLDNYFSDIEFTFEEEC